MLREIPGPVGPLEALLDEPAESRGVSSDGLVHRRIGGRIRAAVVFGHPHPQYGGTMHTKAVYQSAKALARIGCAVLRFNFRGVGRSAGTFDGDAGEKARLPRRPGLHAQRYPGRAAVGGRHVVRLVDWLIGRRRRPARVAAPRRLDAGHELRLRRRGRSAKPKFFIHGERDEICSLKEMREFYARAAEPKELAVIDARRSPV